MLDCHSALMSGIVEIYTFNSIQEQYMSWREDRDYLKHGILQARVESKKVDWTQSALEKMWHALYNMGSNTFVGIEKICKC